MTESEQKKNKLLIVPLLLAICVIAVVSMRNFFPFEKEVFERLMIAFGETESALKVAAGAAHGAAYGAASEPAHSATITRDSLIWLLSFLFSFAGCAIAWKLPDQPWMRAFAFVQAFAISLLCSWAAWKFLQIGLTPVTFVVSITLGFALGVLVRKMEADDTRMQSQFYQLLLRNNELRDVRLQLVRQDEVERRILAADLHDQVLNDMKRLRKKLEAYSKDRSEEQKAEIDQILAATMVEIREVMDSLCPSALEHLGLGAALEDCARKAGEKGGFKARCKSKLEDADVEKLSLVEQSLLYRLVQEALTNVIKHAQAKTVRVNSEVEGNHLIVTISDDGKGIPEGKMSEASRGLRYMRQRADLIGATIVFRAGEGVANPGTTVEIRVDLAGRTAVESTGG